MDVRLRCVSPCRWAIMVRWPRRVRYRRVGTLVCSWDGPGARWLAYIDQDQIERSRKSEALRAFLNAYVVGCCSSHQDPNP